MKKQVLLLLVTGCLTLSGTVMYAQSQEKDTMDILDLSLEELLKVSVSTGAIQKSTIREIPGIVTTYSSDELRKLGARDLMDVLQLVPGVEFGSDTQSSVGLGIRGLWASEGKVSVFIDEYELNDLGYGSVPWGNHFPVEMIEKVEFIRGPGSAIFGGTSQYGVIRIITRAASLNGIRAGNTFGQMNNKPDFRSDNFIQRRNFIFQAGVQKTDRRFSIIAISGNSQRSNGDFEDYYSGEKISFAGRSDIHDYAMIVSAGYKSLKTGFFIDNYSNQGPDYYGLIYSVPLTTRYRTIAGLINWNKQIGKNLALTGELKIRNQNPWYSVDSISWISYDTAKTIYLSDRELTRTNFKLNAMYTPGTRLSILAGAECSLDNGRVKNTSLTNVIPNMLANGKSSASYHTLSGYIQSTYTSHFANFTLGARIEKHSLGFSSFVPRFAVTKVINKFHVKLMASRSFRNPFILNLKSDSIKPETANFLEFETGYMLTRNLFLTATLFDITVDKLIFQFNTPVTGTSMYNNSPDKTGSRGLELELKYIQKPFSFLISYSYHSASGKNHISTFSADPDAVIAGHTGGLTNYFLGFSRHKISWNNSFRINDNIDFNLSGFVIGKRYGYRNDKLGIAEYEPLAIFNSFLDFKNFMVKGASVGIGLYNALNADYRFITPYNATHAAIPSEGREIFIKLAYAF